MPTFSEMRDKLHSALARHGVMVDALAEVFADLEASRDLVHEICDTCRLPTMTVSPMHDIDLDQRRRLMGLQNRSWRSGHHLACPWLDEATRAELALADVRLDEDTP